MPNNRSSVVWKVPEVYFRELIKNSQTKNEVLKKIGLKRHGNNYKTLNKRLEELNIDISHFDPFCKIRRWGKNKKIPLEEILTKNSTYNRGKLKKRLLEKEMLEQKCQECGCSPIWRGKPLVLILDHINGVSDDNRIENLRLLCPNCNSQTDTFAGRNIKKQKKEKEEKTCIDCNIKISSKAQRCRSCAGKRPKRRKVVHPSIEQLELDIRDMSWLAIGRKYNVSDNAVRKWAREYSLL